MLSRINNRLKLKRTWPLHLMLLPGIVIVLIFIYSPMVGNVIAFQNYNPTKGYFGSKWVGLDHFQYLFQLPDTWNVVRNTVVISVSKIVATLSFAIVFALLVNEARRAWVKRFVQSITVFPYFLSWVILGGIVVDILSQNGGAVNQILQSMGLEAIFFLGDPNWFVGSVIVSHVWKDFGYASLIIFAAISGIDPTLYESAVMDGANRWKQTWHITLSSIRPVIILLVTLSLGDILNAGFDQIFNLYNPLVMSTGDIVDTYVYRIGLIDAQYSLATAVGLMKSVIALILIVISYRLAERYANYRIF
jgi:putative aldouronate transport system permease protein